MYAACSAMSYRTILRWAENYQLTFCQQIVIFATKVSPSINRLFMCQDKDENETEYENFCLFYVIPCEENQPNQSIKFTCHRLLSEQIRANDSFGFRLCYVFVVIH